MSRRTSNDGFDAEIAITAMTPLGGRESHYRLLITSSLLRQNSISR